MAGFVTKRLSRAASTAVELSGQLTSIPGRAAALAFHGESSSEPEPTYEWDGPELDHRLSDVSPAEMGRYEIFISRSQINAGRANVTKLLRLTGWKPAMRKFLRTSKPRCSRKSPPTSITPPSSWISCQPTPACSTSAHSRTRSPRCFRAALFCGPEMCRLNRDDRRKRDTRGSSTPATNGYRRGC